MREKGLDVFARNYPALVDEIDIIACSLSTLLFFEVKTRRVVQFGLTQESVVVRNNSRFSAPFSGIYNGKRCVSCSLGLRSWRFCARVT
ncbi:YraN family protein [Malonomonas rubra]|uniref:YraN family protein n=1 Tax=Malonomonas rubra TaxID=57040 RepID=UPI0034E949CA